MLEIARVDLLPRLNAHRVLSVTVSFLSLIGGGIRILGRIFAEGRAATPPLAKTTHEQLLAEQTQRQQTRRSHEAA
jgi:hypothetical protein